MKPKPFIQAKICESRLDDLHPVFGGTTGTFGEQLNWPALDTGLFALSKIEAIEAEDFDDVTGANQPSTTVAKTSTLPPRIDAALRSDIQAPQVGRRVRLEARKLATQDRHKAWQIECRKSKKKYPNKSDVWHSIQIAKLPIAQGKSAETIRKLMIPKK